MAFYDNLTNKKSTPFLMYLLCFSKLFLFYIFN
nr:MAG TPA: hypothetical protein [Caudoviricetes sp.]